MPTPHEHDRIRLKLSTLWIFVTANYLYCDILSLMDPTLLRCLVKGGTPELPITQSFLFYAGLVMEIPLAMIVVSRLLEHRSNRCANLVAGILMTFVQIGSFSMGTSPSLHYWFFSAVEIAATSYIAWSAWIWRFLPAAEPGNPSME
jgi:hypothetical protein